MNKISVFVFGALLLVGCHSGSQTQSTNSSAEHQQATSQETQNLVGEALPVEQQQSQSNEKLVCDQPEANNNICRSDVSIYQSNGWLVQASSEWQIRDNVIPSVNLTLVNPSKRLLMTLLTEDTQFSQSSYVSRQTAFLKDLGAQDVAVESMTLGDNNWSLVRSPGSNLNTYQWMTVKNNKAYVLGCGSPKDTVTDYDSCVGVVDTFQLN